MGHSPVVAWPGYSEAPDGSRFTSMTVRDIEVRIVVAPISCAKSYNTSTQRSASLRAARRETSRDSMSGGISVPVCGKLTTSGASP